MNALPIDIVRHILSYRGSNTFETLHYELISQNKVTKKSLKNILSKIVNASCDDDTLTEKEYQILLKIYKQIETKNGWGLKKHSSGAFYIL